jgi:L-threonylcarbamoyladenylate synthase
LLVMGVVLRQALAAGESWNTSMTGSIHTELLPAHTRAEAQAAVRRAAALLRAGEVVALPTETVYGLAANALAPEAVARLYQAKGRPAHNPIIVHVASLAMARRCVRLWPETARKLAAAFWPGPLTLVLPRAATIPDIVTAGGETVGVRWPSHPFIQAVIRRCGFPLAAPSANLSNRISPTRAEHVRWSLSGRIPLIVDGGRAEVGIESTVVDLTAVPPRILRPGMIHEESLRAALGRRGGPLTGPAHSGRGGLRSPGLLPRHYAPQARLLVLTWSDADDLRRQLSRLEARPAHCQVIAYAGRPAAAGFGGWSVLPRAAAAFARALYAELHRCDEAGARWIVVEAPPARPAWRGIADRLRRAAAPC